MKKYQKLKIASYVYYVSVVVALVGSFLPYSLNKQTISADVFKSDNLNAFILDFFPWALGISGSLAIIVLIVSGYLYITSAGNIEQVNKAKEYIVGALSGLAFLMLAVLIYSTLQS